MNRIADALTSAEKGNKQASKQATLSSRGSSLKVKDKMAMGIVMLSCQPNPRVVMGGALTDLFDDSRCLNERVKSCTGRYIRSLPPHLQSANHHT